MDGFELLEKIRSISELHDTPVIAITSNATRKDIQKGKEHGFDEYITKPIDIVTLLNTINATLNK